MKLKNLQIPPVKQVLVGLSLPSTITVDSTVGLINLTTKVLELEKAYYAAINAVFKSYDIEPNAQGEFVWTGHSKEKEISKKWDELQHIEHNIDITFTEPLLFGKLITGLQISQALILKELLD